MVNNINNNPNVFSEITGEHNDKYVAYSYLNQTGTDNNCCCCNWWCSDFASKLAQGIGGIGSAYVSAKYGKQPTTNTNTKPPATGNGGSGSTNPPTTPMSLGKKVLIGGSIVGGLAVVITIIAVSRKKK